MVYYILNNKVVLSSEKDVVVIPDAIIYETDKIIEDFENYIYNPITKKLEFSETLKNTNIKNNLEVLKQQKIQELKNKKDENIKHLIVQLSNGIKLNADDKSQEKIKSAILILEDNEKMTWVDYQNNSVELTKKDFLEALKLAVNEETKIMVKYNDLRKKINQAQTIDEVNQINIDNFNA